MGPIRGAFGYNSFAWESIHADLRIPRQGQGWDPPGLEGCPLIMRGIEEGVIYAARRSMCVYNFSHIYLRKRKKSDSISLARGR